MGAYQLDQSVEPAGNWAHYDSLANVTYPINDIAIQFQAGEPVRNIMFLSFNKALEMLLKAISQSHRTKSTRTAP